MLSTCSALPTMLSQSGMVVFFRSKLSDRTAVRCWVSVTRRGQVLYYRQAKEKANNGDKRVPLTKPVAFVGDRESRVERGAVTGAVVVVQLWFTGWADAAMVLSLGNNEENLHFLEKKRSEREKKVWLAAIQSLVQESISIPLVVVQAITIPLEWRSTPFAKRGTSVLRQEVGFFAVLILDLRKTTFFRNFLFCVASRSNLDFGFEC